MQIFDKAQPRRHLNLFCFTDQRRIPKPCNVRARPRLASFPLIALQFFLRHFVHYTGFCLVCHCRLEDDLEALKRYVCEKPLCLHKYVLLGSVLVLNTRSFHSLMWSACSSASATPAPNRID